MAVLVSLDAWIDIFRMGVADEELSYVLLAPIVIGWLAWVHRGDLKGVDIRGGWVGIALLPIAWALYWYGFAADPVLWRTGAVLLAMGAVIAGAGTRVLRGLAPAFAAAVFLIPVDPFGRYRIAEPLQNVTAAATQWVCDVVGIYVDRFGASLNINGMDVTVAEACNGMRMVLTLFMVCYVVVFTLPLRTWARLLFLALSPVVAVAANVIRLVPTVWMFGHKSVETAERFHAVSGWAMTFVAFLLLTAFYASLRWAGVPISREHRTRTYPLP